jgi:hypothetical protein
MSGAITAAVIGAGATAYASKKAGDAAKAGKPKKPKEPKYKEATNTLLDIYKDTTSGVQSFEGDARSGYTGLNLTDQQNYLQGVNGQLGYIGQSGLAQQQGAGQIQQARAGEYGSMAGQAGTVRGLLGEMSPEGQRMMQLRANQAEQAYASSQRLTPQEERDSQQNAREAFASSGRLGGNAAVAGEILNRESTLAAKRAEASGAITSAYNVAQNYYSPMQNLLSMTPAGIELGNKYASQGASSLGQATPQLFNYGTAFQQADAAAGLTNQYEQQKAAAALQSGQSSAQMWSSLGNTASSLIGSMASNPSMYGGVGMAQTGQNAYANLYNNTAGLFGAAPKAYTVA